MIALGEYRRLPIESERNTWLVDVIGCDQNHVYVVYKEQEGKMMHPLTHKFFQEYYEKVHITPTDTFDIDGKE
jgi:hypothetical protein